MANSQTYLNSYRITDPTGGSFSIAAPKGSGGLNGAQSNNITLSDGTSTGSTQTGENFNVLGDVVGDAVNNGVNNGTSTYIGIGSIGGVQGVIVNDPNGQGGGGYFFLTGVTLSTGTTGTAVLASAAASSTWWTLGGTATPAILSGITAADNVGALQVPLASGARTDDTTPTLTGTADAGATIKIYLNAATSPVATVSANASGQWSWTPTTALAQGTYSYTATQTNTAGLTSAVSAAFVVTVDTTAPAAPTGLAALDNVGALQVPLASGARTDDTTPTLTGTAEQGATVKIYLDGATSPVATTTADAAGNWSYTPSAGLTQGSHSYTATATDAAGNTSGSSTTFVVIVDTTAPAAPTGLAALDNVGALQDPLASGARTDDTTPTLTGTAEQGATVKIYLDGATSPVATTTADAAGNWSYTPSAGLIQGSHSYTATATDAAGNTSGSSTTFVVIVDTTAPAAPTGLAALDNVGALQDPLASGARTDDTTPTLTGTAEQGATVKIYLDGATSPVATTTADAAGNWSYTPSAGLIQGSHSYTATATDAAGNTSGSSTTFVVIVDTTAPAAPTGLAALDNVGALQDPLASGARTDDTTPTLTGTAEQGATVKIYLDGATSPVATTTADAAGNWSYTPSAGLTQGSHSYTATATDAAGNSSGSTDAFLLTVDDPLCYLEGTRILTPTGETPVESLKIGDAVVTRWGGIQSIKWIGRQSFSARFIRGNRTQIPVRIEAGAFGDRLPARTLFVSPGHSMLVGESLVLAKSLVNGVTITQTECPDTIKYFQIELSAHDCVIAEGTWSETYADYEGQRDQFHNAAEFEQLYPDQRPVEELQLCAPRPEHGAKLEAVLRPVVARASAGTQCGPLQGAIDRITGMWAISGWAQDQKHPELPVLLEVLLEERVIGTVLACDYRPDLLKGGLGQGRCSFVFRSPAKIRPEVAGTVRIRRAADGAQIWMTADCRARIERSRMARPVNQVRLVS